MRVGVEVGGTFTDLVAIEDGRVRVAKVPSVPARPDEGAMASLAAGEIDLATVADLVHGSTVATNAILERKGAPVALLTTRGFRDVLFLQRHNRTQIYDLFYKKPEPVLARRDILEIDERMSGQGEVVEALDEAATAKQLQDFLGSGQYQSVAICLLNGYAEPKHERQLAALVAKQFPDLTITCSADVTREFREYERTSTTTLAAYVQPVIDSYLRRFESQLGEQNFTGRFSIMQSNGGRLPVAGMSRNAITSLFSGPAAGVMGAVRQAGLSGYGDLITLDMGGTSTDVCLVADGKPNLSGETEVDGLPIRTPVLDIVTVGAGGGSICWQDDGGMLRVGPESAGADPGPACYGRGGTRPAITDAHMVRGTIRAEEFLGGNMDVDKDAAASVFKVLSNNIDMSLEDAADSAVRVADANIVGAIQLVSTERGRDPRDYVLVPFGGAGPLHAARVAEELDISTILVPPNAGVLSAYGLLASDFLQYETLTRRIPLSEGEGAAQQVRSLFGELQDRITTSFRDLGIDDDLQYSYSLDMRFIGQAFEITVDIDGSILPNLSADDLLALFNEAHNRVFSFGESGMHRAEIVSFRLGASAAPEVVPALNEGISDNVSRGETKIFDRGEWRQCALLSRAAIALETNGVPGPALVEDGTSTIFVPDGWTATVDTQDNILLKW
ncbi:MAG: hydantoinase/oxoprolinase family protein, partial [Rhodospirillaceae bacterium]|nr:hydantoinase/oxoprolinase family protein [Rhodospirillaceae bacterium]